MANGAEPLGSLALVAPAKINLFLHVTGRREDGYHLLESVFAPVTLADTVRLTLRADGEVKLLNPPEGLNETSDLACQAARALQLASHCKFGVDIELVKRIPQGAGLGGGSSDCATTLLGLNRLWNLARSRDELQEIGTTLGADVPFFVFGQSALVQGIGEKLRAVTLPTQHLVIASPGVAVATQSVFAHPDLERGTAVLQTPVFSVTFGHNDLQPVATRLQPEMERLRSAIAALGLQPKMTGSGSCMFALAHGASQAGQIGAHLRHAGWRCWSVRTTHLHPLHSFANSARI